MEQLTLFEEIDVRPIREVPVDAAARRRLVALMAEVLLQALRQKVEVSKDADQ